MAHSYASGVVGHNCHSPVGYFTASLPDILSRRYRFIASSFAAAACSTAAIETFGEGGGKSRPLIAKSRDKWGHPRDLRGAPRLQLNKFCATYRAFHPASSARAQLERQLRGLFYSPFLPLDRKSTRLN